MSSRRLIDLQDKCYSTEMFHEANSQRDGMISRQDSPSYQPETIKDWIVSGPHFYVATPFNKTSRTDCTSNDRRQLFLPSPLPQLRMLL